MNRLTRVLGAGLIVVALGACGDDSSQAPAASARRSTTTAAPSTTAAVDTTTTAPAGSTSAPATIPDQVGDIGVGSDCTVAGASFAALLATTSGTEGAMELLRRSSEELATKLPSSLQDELVTVTDGVSQAADRSGGSSDPAVTTKEFTTARDTIQKYLNKGCP